MCSKRRSLSPPHPEVRCSGHKARHDVPNDDKDVPAESRRDNQSNTPQTLRIPSPCPAQSFEGYELRVLSKVAVLFPRGKLQVHFALPKEFHDTRDIALRVRP